MLFDAHCHWHDSKLETIVGAADFFDRLKKISLSGSVVNGTSPEDWPGVSALCERAKSENFTIFPAFGLHPWKVEAFARSCLPENQVFDPNDPSLISNVENYGKLIPKLAEFLQNNKSASIGEIGLDYAILGGNSALQEMVFVSQLRLAISENRAATIHCVRAWHALAKNLHLVFGKKKPKFLLHAFCSPAELVPEFVKFGAYFSFSPSFVHPKKSAICETFRHLPQDRILIETDSPSMPPPCEQNPNPATCPQGMPINHPQNLLLAAEFLAKIRGTTLAKIAEITTQNAKQLFC